MFKFLSFNLFPLSLVLFIFSKEFLTIDEEFLVSLCLILAFLILVHILKDSVNDFANSRTNVLLNYYSNFFATQLYFRNEFYFRLNYNLLLDIYGWYIILKIRNDILYSSVYNFFLKKIFFNYFINEILISYLLYSFYIINTSIISKCRISNSKLQIFNEKTINLDFLKNDKINL